jgi:hypothetical protein
MIIAVTLGPRSIRYSYAPSRHVSLCDVMQCHAIMGAKSSGDLAPLHFQTAPLPSDRDTVTGQRVALTLYSNPASEASSFPTVKGFGLRSMPRPLLYRWLLLLQPLNPMAVLTHQLTPHPSGSIVSTLGTATPDFD